MKLESFMATHRLSVSNVSAICGVGRKTVYNWRGGHQAVPLVHARLLQFFVALPQSEAVKCMANIFVEAEPQLRYSREAIAAYRKTNDSFKVFDDATICDLIDSDNGKITVA